MHTSRQGLGDLPDWSDCRAGLPMTDSELREESEPCPWPELHRPAKSKTSPSSRNEVKRFLWGERRHGPSGSGTSFCASSQLIDSALKCHSGYGHHNKGEVLVDLVRFELPRLLENTQVIDSTMGHKGQKCQKCKALADIGTRPTLHCRWGQHARGAGKMEGHG